MTIKKQISKKRNTSVSSTRQITTDNLPIASTPPVFEGFEIYKHDDSGFYIRNTSDGSIFKWMDITQLRNNGFFVDRKRPSRAGRRNFEGNVWNCFKRGENRSTFVETDDKSFRKAVREFGGFYLAVYRATYVNNDEDIAFIPGGKKVDMLTSTTVIKNGAHYAKKFCKNQEFSSAVPCGAAMDCFAEDAYERLEKEVKEFKGPDESMYDAWNRYAKKIIPRLRAEGIYGIMDFFATGEAEITTESFGDVRYHNAVRDGNRGVFLIGNSDFEKKEMNCYFEVGHRNFISNRAQFIGYGYRIMLLPQKVNMSHNE